jgi:hypothetical protein
MSHPLHIRYNQGEVHPRSTASPLLPLATPPPPRCTSAGANARLHRATARGVPLPVRDVSGLACGAGTAGAADLAERKPLSRRRPHDTAGARQGACWPPWLPVFLAEKRLSRHFVPPTRGRGCLPVREPPFPHRHRRRGRTAKRPRLAQPGARPLLPATAPRRTPAAGRDLRCPPRSHAPPHGRRHYERSSPTRRRAAPAPKLLGAPAPGGWRGRRPSVSQPPPAALRQVGQQVHRGPVTPL